MEQFLSIASLIGLPLITALVTWVWKLDSRIFTLYSIVLTREEFVKSMAELRAELKDTRARMDIEDRRHR